MPARRIFILSPARLGGARGRALLEGRSSAPFAGDLREGVVPLAEVFAFISSLYFRGKRRYADRFADPPEGVAGAWVVTASRGLVPAETPVGLADLAAMARHDIDPDDAGYVERLQESARGLRERLGDGHRVVLLGSLASGKYVEPLLAVFGDALEVPVDFVGRGDMSRGGLMLRRVDAGEELAYAPVAGLHRRGPRPPKLGKR